MKQQLMIITAVATTTMMTQAATITNVLNAEINTAAGWSGSALPVAGDIVTFERDGKWGNSGWGDAPASWDGVVVNHTAGTLTGSTPNVLYNKFINTTWNLSGTGVITASDDLYNMGLNMTVSNGGTINSKSLQLTDAIATTVSIMDGGTVNLRGQYGYAVRIDAPSTLNLSGGIINLTGNSALFQMSKTSGVTNVSGAFNFVASDSTTLFTSSNVGTLNFNSNWTGSFDLSDTYLAADIQTALIDSGATFDGVDIDATNISNFNIQNGSISAVPEPSTGALLGLAGLTLILRRNK